MAGDIPNFVLTVDADGTAHATTTAHYVTLVSDNNSVFSNGGTSLVIHAVAVKCLRAHRRESHAEYREAVAGGLNPTRMTCTEHEFLMRSRSNGK